MDALRIGSWGGHGEHLEGFRGKFYIYVRLTVTWHSREDILYIIFSSNTSGCNDEISVHYLLILK